MKHNENSARLKMIGAMVIFGTIGILKNYITLSAGMIAMVRGLIGVLFLLAVMAIKHQKLSFAAIRQNLWLLLISGALIGFNWILLFEAYGATSVATATLCYYMAPVFVTLAAPLVLRERLTGLKLVLSLVAFVGMTLVSDIFNVGISDIKELRGIGFGLAAAALYATVILLNKKLREISAYDRTVMQLGVAFLVLVPYVALKDYLLRPSDSAAMVFTPLAIVLLVIMGVVHTGLAYVMYFDAMRDLPAQTVSIFSYIDPIVAVLLSFAVLGTRMDGSAIVGGVLILGATLVGELWKGKKKK